MPADFGPHVGEPFYCERHQSRAGDTVKELTEGELRAYLGEHGLNRVTCAECTEILAERKPSGR